LIVGSLARNQMRIPALMRARRDRPCGAAEQLDELAPL